MALATLSFIAEMVVDSSIENVACACIVYASSMMALLYLSWSKAFQLQPLSGFIVLGFCVTTQFGALVAQAISWTPLTYALYDPLYTFGTLGFYQALVIGVHFAYCHFRSHGVQPDGLVRTIFRRLGVYRWPSAYSLWLMGVIGSVGIFYSLSLQPFIHGVANGIKFLAWGPFLLPVYETMLPEGNRPGRSSTGLVAVYAVLVALLSLSVGRRSEMLVGAVTVALLLLLAGIQSNAVLRGKIVARLAIWAILVAVLVKPLSMLSTAVEMARALDPKKSPVVIIDKTLGFLSQPSKIESYRKQTNRLEYLTSYDETYFKNPFVAKMLETKFIDNALHFGKSINSEADIDRLWEATRITLLALVPTPVLDALDIHINKQFLYYSTGDYLVYLSKGDPLGFERTGSLFGQGLVLFGITFPFVYALGCLVVFQLISLLTIKDAPMSAKIAAPAMLSIWPLFQHGIASESFQTFLGFIVREFAQIIVIYTLALVMSGLLFGRRRIFSQCEPGFTVAK